jgi:Protein of unknown function (DUF3822)
MRTEPSPNPYDPAKERAWHLSVWLSPEVTAWCAHDVHTGRCVALRDGKGDELPDPSFLPVRPVSVSFTALPEISTLVPESALAPGSEMSHLKMVHGQLPTGMLRDEPISALGARCVYLHDEQAEHRLMTRYPNARSLPLQAVLVNGVLARSAKKSAFLLHRTATRSDIAIATDQQLLLSNTFHTTNAEDVLYFSLFALEQVGLKPEDVHAYICGTHLTTTDEDLLARYLPRVLPALSRTDSLASSLNNPAPHSFTALLEQFACAL